MKNMRNKLVLLAGSAVFSTLFSIALSVATFAIGGHLNLKNGISQSRGVDTPSNLFGGTGIFTQIVNILLFIVGILSVIMLIAGGLKYIMSGGDSKKVDNAKNTVLYAIVGLVVSILAYAIVRFVVNIFLTNNGTGGGSLVPDGTAPTNV